MTTTRAAINLFGRYWGPYTLPEWLTPEILERMQYRMAEGNPWSPYDVWTEFGVDEMKKLPVRWEQVEEMVDGADLGTDA